MKTDVLVIGGGPSGIVSAVTGKIHYPDKKFTLVCKKEPAMVPCGIPYIFGELKGEIEKNIMSYAPVKNAGIDVICDEVVSINKDESFCETKKGEKIYYEKLVIATGSLPNRPGWLKGVDLENVFLISKDKDDLDELLNKLKNIEKIVVIGGGFIGAEISDELTKAGKKVTIVELLPHILSLAFDEDLSVRAENILKNRGIDIKTNKKVTEILGDEKVKGVKCEDGETIEADAVILAMGYKPNVELAKNAGILINDYGFIKVDEYMRTSMDNVFAVGDCAEKRDFITRRINRVMLASTATSEARIAGMNLYKLSTLKTFGGTISIFSTAFGNNGFGVAGVTESVAKREGFDYVAGDFECPDKHPGVLPDAKKLYVKLIALKEGGIIIGGAVAGGESTGELTNLLGFIIENRMTVNTIITSQIGTHPLLTSAPTVYPLIKAAENIVKKI